MKKFLSILALMCVFAIGNAQKKLQPVDEGSKVHFVIKNLGINTGGDLTGLKGSIVLNQKKPTASSADVTVNVSTIDTDNERRDGHLNKEDYFDVAKFSTMRIKSTSITAGTGAGNYNFAGTLTIKDVTKNISFPFSVVPSGANYMFSGDFSINRLDYGIGKESATMSDDVKVSLQVIAK